MTTFLMYFVLIQDLFIWNLLWITSWYGIYYQLQVSCFSFTVCTIRFKITICGYT